MRRRPRWKRSHLQVERAAGWLFADLLLVLFLVGIGSQMTQLAEAPPVEPAPTPAPTPVKPLTMSQTPVEYVVRADLAALRSSDPAATAAEKTKLKAQISDATSSLAGRRAAMVLVWGDASEPATGIELATAAGEQLAPARADVFTGAAQKRVWWAQGEEGQVKLEIYMFE